MAAAAYDYYPFGMLMPERYVEDGSTQCIPVTHTRYVTKEEEVRTVTAASENLTSYAASPGVRLRFMQGVDVLDPDVALPGNGGPEELGFIQAEQEEEAGSTEMKLSVTSPGTGVDMRLTTYVMNQKSAELRAEDMATGSEGIIVEVRQYVSGVEAPQVLGRQLLWEQASIDIPVKTIGPGDIEISISDLMNRGKFSVGTVQVTRKDVVQDNYVVMTCNTDELGGSDYRFGFNGQMKVNEIAGTGNHNTAQFWEYDTRTARRWNLDPVDQISMSNYSVLSGNPISRVDPLGNTDDHIEVDAKEKTYRVTPTNDQYDIVSERKYNENGSVPVVNTDKNGNPIHYPKGYAQNQLKGKGYTQKAAFRGAQSEEFAIEMAALDGAGKLLGKGVKWAWGRTFGGAATKAGAEAAVAQGGTSYAKLLAPQNEFDVVKTLYRGTTGSEAGSTVLFLTDDAAVAATYVKNGGQVMQYQVTEFGLKNLYQAGELTMKTGAHGTAGAASTEYVFYGKDLVQTVNNLATPLK